MGHLGLKRGQNEVLGHYLALNALVFGDFRSVCCGRVGEEAKLGSRYSQLLTNTYVVCLRLERYTLMFRELTISSDVCLSNHL